ncbi:hypothetical protein K503DRAFT_787606 [Rhizopogon vinicolor AM-OR11-026]|uniref:Uncharacterized protein n=1 Tax=Rhizopogon vinicolor AM-OR11-026 TaxID=1314800 RepID=A0A1B7MGS9_9AGAM|nr:hypothetical protein K503DRAFT_787606 [Rhizopogon vinicolor AM-OR11-026]
MTNQILSQMQRLLLTQIVQWMTAAAVLISYKKGPDVGSKSVRTQRQYEELLRNQRSLTSLGFTVLPKLNQPALITPATKDSESSPSTPCQDPEPDLESEGNTSDVSTAPPVAESQLSAGLARGVREAWEEELEEQEWSGVDIRSWDELREQIKKDLAKGGKALPLSQERVGLQPAWKLHISGAKKKMRTVDILIMHLQDPAVVPNYMSTNLKRKPRDKPAAYNRPVRWRKSAGDTPRQNLMSHTLRAFSLQYIKTSYIIADEVRCEIAIANGEVTDVDSDDDDGDDDDNALMNYMHRYPVILSFRSIYQYNFVFFVVPYDKKN